MTEFKFGSQPASDSVAGIIELATAAETLAGLLNTRAITPLTLIIPNHLTGLVLSNAADTDHDITVAVGWCMDSANAFGMRLASALTKQIDAAWAVGTNAGGMFTGAVGNATWYHVHLIRKDSDGSIDAGFDTSVTAANKPAGYSNYRRIGSVLTDGSANIYAFVQTGDTFEFSAYKADISATNPGTAAVLATMSIPLGVVTEGIFYIGFYETINNAAMVLSDPNVTDSAAASTNGCLGGSTAGWVWVGNMHLLSNTSSQIRYRLEASGAGTVVKISTVGWVDRRGRD